MNDKMNLQVKEFIDEIGFFFPNIILDMEEYDDSIVILHNNKDCFIGEFAEKSMDLFKKYFRDNGIYDVGFSYEFTLPLILPV